MGGKLVVKSEQGATGSYYTSLVTQTETPYSLRNPTLCCLDQIWNIAFTFSCSLTGAEWNDSILISDASLGNISMGGQPGGQQKQKSWERPMEETRKTALEKKKNEDKRGMRLLSWNIWKVPCGKRISLFFVARIVPEGLPKTKVVNFAERLKGSCNERKKRGKVA